jgi:broad specificity phosphatase PhoE
MMQHIRIALFTVAATLWSLSADSQTASPQPEWVNGLRSGGYVFVFRHGATHADQADTDPLHPENVAAQRQLNDQGRALARAIGAAIRKLNIPVAQVHTSVFNRAVETGRLLEVGEVKPSVDYSEGGLVVSPNENDRRAEALRKLASTPPPAGGNIVLVTHKHNILDAFGKDFFDVREGEALVFRPEAGGAYTPVVRIKAEEWSRLAQ